MMMDLNKQGTAAGRYEKLSSLREPVLDRARQCAELTIPALFPPKDYNDSNSLDGAQQALGSKGINNLSSKLMLATLPPNTPFFKIGINPDLLPPVTGNKDQDDQAEKEKADIENALAKLEEGLLTDIGAGNDRPTRAEGFKHILIGGNVLIHDAVDDGLRLFRLDNYVIVREYSGRPLEIITEEKVVYESLDDEMREIIDKNRVEGEVDENGVEELTLYTWLTRIGDMWSVHQEIEDTIIPSTSGKIKDSVFNYYPLRMYKEDGRDYSRSLVEDLFPDLDAYDSLSGALVDASIEMARIINLVQPNATVDIRDLEQARSGDYIEGGVDDVKAYQMEKFPDLQFVSAEKQILQDSLKESFLMNSSVQRNAERVTAHEVAFVAKELDSGLSGYYSLDDAEFQKPFLRRRIHLMKKANRFPKEITEDMVKLTITTGVEALGRNQELMKMNEFLNIPPQIPAELYMPYVDIAAVLKVRETATGMFGITKSQQAVDAERQQAMQQQMAQQLAPEAVKQLGSSLGGQQSG